MKKFKEIYEAVMGVQQRKKAARRMAKMGKSKIVQAKKKRAALRMRSPAKLAILARKKAIQMMRDKFYPAYKTMALAQRVKVDQVIMQKYGKKIAKIAKKLAMKLKKQKLKELKKQERPQKMRRFKDLMEASNTMVFAFGRFNPPTTGHEKLIKKVSSISGSDPFRI